MKPIYLELAGFGAYAKKQAVDFEKLDGKNIFVITGPTGAGKTTIFDAIAYALFDTASGNSRDSKTVRSDYADETMDTYVDLIFEVKNQRYRIKRNPEYLRKKLKGEGTLKVRDKVELVMPDKTVFTKKTDVNNKIKEILGIDKDQFKQIVMLPQGEFKKMLESSSEEKEKIFRKVFNTEKFNNIQEYLKNKSKSMYVDIKSMVEQRNTNISNIECDEDSKLYELINREDKDVDFIIEKAKIQIRDEEQKLAEITESINKKKEEMLKVNNDKAKAEEVNKNIEQKNKVEEQKKEMESKISVVKEKEHHLNRAKKALKVLSVEEKLNEKIKSVENEKNELSEITKKIAVTEEQFKKSIEDLKSEESKEDLRVKTANEIADLKKYLDRIKGYEAKKNEILKNKQQLTALDNSRITCTKRVEELKKNILALEKENEEVQKAKVEREKKLQQYNEVNNIIKVIEEYQSKIKLKNDKFVIHKEQSALYIEKQKEAEREKHQYEYMDECYKREQAGILALNLEEGTPCPVCGSVSHPQPAKVGGTIYSEDQIKKQKKIYEEADKAKNEKYNEVQKLNAEIKMFDDQLNDIKANLKKQLEEASYKFDVEKNMEESLYELKAIRTKIINHGKQLKAEIDKEQNVKSNLENSKNECEKDENTIKSANEKYTELLRVTSAFEAEVKSLEADIPEEIRSTLSLLAKIKEKENILEEMKKALESARKVNNDLNMKLTAEKTTKLTKISNIEKFEKDTEELKVQVNNVITEQGFTSHEDYSSSIMQEEQIDELDRRIRKFHEDLAVISNLFDNLAKKTKDFEVQDISKFDEMISALREEEKALAESQMKLNNRVNNNKKTLDNITEITAKISSKEEKYKVLAKVSNMALGNNSNKISFERYVLAAYFDDVIKAANVRLDKLADGRFFLSRSEETLDGRKRKEGLEMNVYDYYTGKSRPVKTLSGGESFKASLALALGLSDVIQSYAGGVEMNTMFVDEGFGTLDDDSLENAIECLLDLQSGGRLVGIISHVQSLKDRIGTRIEVTKDVTGSSLKLILQ
ncbi:AAA family ATPase [Inconstantimicrobium porci]|uniref:AAA family ATPase n=1 Tax=Inconstantimicrobium porci TaxID=2652291 RepID=UPI00240956DC|nr:SMC family ATPase [Inconstantimicrobium porci]MDD6771822.1 SMC family ATPase [Inconstantimicrobium porci]